MTHKTLNKATIQAMIQSVLDKSWYGEYLTSFKSAAQDQLLSMKETKEMIEFEWSQCGIKLDEIISHTIDFSLAHIYGVWRCTVTGRPMILSLQKDLVLKLQHPLHSPQPTKDIAISNITRFTGRVTFTNIIEKLSSLFIEMLETNTEDESYSDIVEKFTVQASEFIAQSIQYEVLIETDNYWDIHSFRAFLYDPYYGYQLKPIMRTFRGLLSIYWRSLKVLDPNTMVMRDRDSEVMMRLCAALSTKLMEQLSETTHG